MCLSLQVLFQWPLSHRFLISKELQFLFSFSFLLCLQNTVSLRCFQNNFWVQTNCYSSMTWLNKLCAVCMLEKIMFYCQSWRCSPIVIFHSSIWYTPTSNSLVCKISISSLPIKNTSKCVWDPWNATLNLQASYSLRSHL